MWYQYATLKLAVLYPRSICTQYSYPINMYVIPTFVCHDFSELFETPALTHGHELVGDDAVHVRPARRISLQQPLDQRTGEGTDPGRNVVLILFDPHVRVGQGLGFERWLADQ